MGTTSGGTVRTRYDVVIVGCGPVGQTLAGLLGARGHTVGVFERHDDIYPLPRAVRLDGEAMRTFQEIGVAAAIADELHETTSYTWFGADGEVILDISIPLRHPGGWASSYVFHQPTTERALVNKIHSMDTVSVHFGWEFEGFCEIGDGVVARVRPTDSNAATTDIDCLFLIGADGANSAVRNSAQIDWNDLGFAEPWLVVDIVPHDMADFDHLPDASQFCDPSRPTTVVRNGNHRRRWEFMLLPGETPSDFAAEANMWALLEGWVRPDQCTIERHAVYTFRSLLANETRRGSVLIAGDAAHLMPPFLGEGMCSGIRDAANLAWKLDLVLQGRSTAQLLDSYHAERAPVNRFTVEASLFMGKVSCTLDPQEAAGRDAAFRAGEVPPPPAAPPLQGGVTRDASSDPLAGTTAVQGVSFDETGDRVLADDAVGRGFRLLTFDGAGARAALADIAVRDIDIVVVDVTDDRNDVDGSIAAWLSSTGRVAALVRPDHYVFGSAAGQGDVGPLVDDLMAALHLS